MLLASRSSREEIRQGLGHRHHLSALSVTSGELVAVRMLWISGDFEEVYIAETQGIWFLLFLPFSAERIFSGQFGLVLEVEGVMRTARLLVA